MNSSVPENFKCRIAVDAMGGDFAPQNTVIGAIQALNEIKNFELYLVGREKEILDVISGNNLSFEKKNIINADEVIEMGESPTSALKKKTNSSIVVGAKLVKDKKAEAFVSAGNTGALMAIARFVLKMLPGIDRPAISVVKI